MAIQLNQVDLLSDPLSIVAAKRRNETCAHALIDCMCALRGKTIIHLRRIFFAYYLNRLINDVDVNGSEIKDLQ